MSELVIRNARLLLPEGIVTGEMSIENGKIKKISVSGVEKGEREIDAKNKLIIPGIIDTEAHILTRSKQKWKIFKEETAAAAAAGVTTVLISPEPLQLTNVFEIKKALKFMKKFSLVDFCFQAGPITGASISKMAEISVAGTKIFKIRTCEPEKLTNEEILEVMKIAKTLDLILCAHAESEEVIKEKSDEEVRPPLAEEKAVEELLEKVRKTGATVHFGRITTQKACLFLSKAEKEHLTVSGGTCVHYLVFSKEDSEKNPLLKMCPPLRSKEDVENLWKAIDIGAIDAVASGHFFIKMEEVKNLEPARAPEGLPGIEALLPVMFELGVRNGRITIETMVKVLSTRPAQIFRLYPRKGVLREGSDADLVILNPSHKKISAKKLIEPAGWTPYEEMELSGFSDITISRGEIIYENGEVCGKPGRGQFLTNF
ncbi:MAG: dihydroorotase family protein [Candidatus Hadarchaeales archaeon]